MENTRSKLENSVAADNTDSQPSGPDAIFSSEERLKRSREAHECAWRSFVFARQFLTEGRLAESERLIRYHEGIVLSLDVLGDEDTFQQAVTAFKAVFRAAGGIAKAGVPQNNPIKAEHALLRLQAIYNLAVLYHRRYLLLIRSSDGVINPSANAKSPVSQDNRTVQQNDKNIAGRETLGMNSNSLSLPGNPEGPSGEPAGFPVPKNAKGVIEGGSSKDPGQHGPSNFDSRRENPVSYFLQAHKYYELVFEELELKQPDDLQTSYFIYAVPTPENLIKYFDGVLRRYLNPIFLSNDFACSTGSDDERSIQYSANRRGAAVYLAATVGLSNLLLEAPSYGGLTQFEEESTSAEFRLVAKTIGSRKGEAITKRVETALKAISTRLDSASKIAAEAKRYELAVDESKSFAQRGVEKTEQDKIKATISSIRGGQQDPQLRSTTGQSQPAPSPQHQARSFMSRVGSTIRRFFVGDQGTQPVGSHSSDALDSISDALEQEINRLIKAKVDFEHIVAKLCTPETTGSGPNSG